MSNPITAPDSSLEHPMPVTSTINQLSAPVGVTLQRFIANEQRNYPQAKGDFTQLLADISLAAKIINRDINRAGLINLEGSAGAENIQGEDQQKLDVIANTRFARALRLGGKVCCIISEEEDELVHTGNEQAKYVIAIDPLDGSSNIGVNVSIGTIFSIYRRRTQPGTSPTMEDALQAGSQQLASGYVLYGSSTILVLTTGHGVNAFTYEPSLGEFFLSHTQLRFRTTEKSIPATKETSITSVHAFKPIWNLVGTGTFRVATLAPWSPTSTAICSRAGSICIHPLKRPLKASYA